MKKLKCYSDLSLPNSHMNTGKAEGVKTFYSDFTLQPKQTVKTNKKNKPTPWSILLSFYIKSFLYETLLQCQIQHIWKKKGSTPKSMVKTLLLTNLRSLP